MKEINDVLKRNNIRALNYEKIGNVIIVNSNKGKYVIKKNNIDSEIFKYLNNRDFKEYPHTIFDSDYIITTYEEEDSIPNEQKMFDLINTVSTMHAKTSFYKEVSDYEYKTIYEDLLNNCEYLYIYYNDWINSVDNRIVFGPSDCALGCGISFILKSIENTKSQIKEWYKKVENLNKMRVSIIHNNLDLNHFIINKKNYLISWDKSKIDIPIFDLYKLYNKYYLNYNFIELLKSYEKNYPLKDYEKDLLLILINMPNKIIYTDEYNTCVNISNEIDRLYKSNKLKETLVIN